MSLYPISLSPLSIYLSIYLATLSPPPLLPPSLPLSLYMHTHTHTHTHNLYIYSSSEEEKQRRSAKYYPAYLRGVKPAQSSSAFADHIASSLLEWTRCWGNKMPSRDGACACVGASQWRGSVWSRPHRRDVSWSASLCKTLFRPCRGCAYRRHCRVPPRRVPATSSPLILLEIEYHRVWDVELAAYPADRTLRGMQGRHASPLDA